MTSRIHRGFHRVGVVLAAPVLLVAVGLAGHEASLQWTTKDPYAAFERVPEPKKQPNVFDQFDPPGRAATQFAAPAYRADYTMALAALVLACAFYAAARAVGWVLAGFMGPRDREPS